MVDKREILEIVKILKNIKTTDQDDLLLIYIDMAIQAVLIYCNRDDLPNELKYVVAKMAYDSYIEGLLVDRTISYGDITEITDGSSTVRFAESGQSSSDKPLVINKGIISNKVLLDRYRLLYKV